MQYTNHACACVCMQKKRVRGNLSKSLLKIICYIAAVIQQNGPDTDTFHAMNLN